MKANESLQNDQATATERALRRAVDTTPAFIHTARPDGYIDYFNRGWLDFFGKSLEDVCGWRWTETVHPEDVTAIVQKWRSALASGEPFEIESRVRRADGSYRALLHRKLPFRDEHGNIVKWFGSSTDIEDRRCAERRIAEKTAELERSEFYLREGERLAHMGSWSLSPDGIFDYWSPETFSIFGFDSRNGIPTLREWLSVLLSRDGDAVHELIRRMFSEGVNGDIQYRVDHPKGGQRTMHSTGEPVFENGKVVRLIGNTLDITEEETATRELQRSKAYLAEAQRLALRAATKLVPEGAILETFELDGVPVFNQDEEQNPPAKVTELKRRIREADAILFVTPEYNYSVSGVLKNAIDWASRPYGDSAWNGKPAAIMGASPGAMGTARAQYHLRQMLVFLNMFPINQPEVMIAHAEERFDQEGNLTDTITKEFILALLQNLVEWTRRIGTAPLQSRVKDV